MKYLFLLMLVLLCASSCESIDSCNAAMMQYDSACVAKKNIHDSIAHVRNQEKIERQLAQAEFAQAVGGKHIATDVAEFSYKGHNYIWFAKSKTERSESSRARGFGFAGVVHDPDCPCNK